MGIEEQRAARLATERLMAPYVQAGTGSLEAQQAILGLLGPEAQQQAYAVSASFLGIMFVTVIAIINLLLNLSYCNQNRRRCWSESRCRRGV